jgi:transposase
MPAQPRDHKEMERRRKRAAVMFEKGYAAAEVARRVGVSRQATSRWKNAWNQGGQSGLASKGTAGRKPRLDGEQHIQIIEALLEGPVARGYRTNLWTLPRVALLIKDLTGVAYHPGHVWHFLRALNFSCQRPTRRAIERDEKKIAHWNRYVWPKLKKKRCKSGAPLSSSTKAA